jgi:hypothetical protein
MDRKTYYVSVQAGTVLEDRESAAFEFEIQATEKEVEQLMELFEAREDAEASTFLRGTTPGLPYHQDPENDSYDDALYEVYRMIHRLGTPETKEHIEKMGILQDGPRRDKYMLQ